MLPRIPELVVVILGTLRAGAVYQPLFTAFGPKAIEHRLEVSKSKMVVTDSANRGKLDEVGNCPVVAMVDTPATATSTSKRKSPASQILSSR